MNRIIANVEAGSFLDKNIQLCFKGLVDTEATYLMLPRAWRGKFGEFIGAEEIETQTTDGQVIKGEICGPLRIRLEQYRAFATEVLFTDLEPDEEGIYEPRIGCVPLAQSLLAVDSLGEKLTKIRYFDLK